MYSIHSNNRLWPLDRCIHMTKPTFAHIHFLFQFSFQKKTKSFDPMTISHFSIKRTYRIWQNYVFQSNKCNFNILGNKIYTLKWQNDSFDHFSTHSPFEDTKTLMSSSQMKNYLRIVCFGLLSEFSKKKMLLRNG